MASVEQLLSHRLLKSAHGKQSRPIVRLAIASIAVCLVIIVLAISITSGYRQAIEQKIIDMGSHIRISHNDQSLSYDAKPMAKDPTLIAQLKDNPDIAHIQFAAMKSGVVKTDDQVEGIVLKGIDGTFSWEMFDKNLEQGNRLHVNGDTITKGVLVSRTLADKMKLKIGDKLRSYFWTNGTKYDRAFWISGIYSTGMPEYDERFVIGDLRHIQKINSWGADSVGCVEVLVSDYNKLDEVGEFVHHNINYDLKAETIRQLYPAIFEWTDLFDTNVVVLLSITMFICLITLISTFFIIILEQTSSIGILKSMGMTTGRIRNVFMRLGMRIILLGMLIGNTAGLGLCLLQSTFHLVKLDAAAYYVSFVPIAIPWAMLAVINICVLLICLLVLLIPATFVSKRITPVSAIKFE